MTRQLMLAFIQFQIEKILIKLPLLAIPVLNPIFTWLFTKIAVFLYDQLVTIVSMKVIDINVYRSLVAYDISWQAIKKETDRTKIHALRLEYNEKLKNLISFNSNFVRIG